MKGFLAVYWLAVLPRFENSLILLPLYCMTHGWADYGLYWTHASAHHLYSINNGIMHVMAFRKLGNTASKQLGSLCHSHYHQEQN